MGMVQIIADIEARMKVVMQQLALPMPKFLVGIDKLRQYTPPPRIVWVPTKGPIRGAKVAGGRGSLWERRAGLDVHIWGDDVEATEALMQHLVAVMQDVMPASYDVLSEDWTTAKQEATAKGELLVLGVAFRMPLVRETTPTARPTTMPITPAVVPAS